MIERKKKTATKRVIIKKNGEKLSSQEDFKLFGYIINVLVQLLGVAERKDPNW